MDLCSSLELLEVLFRLLPKIWGSVCLLGPVELLQLTASNANSSDKLSIGTVVCAEFLLLC